MINVATGGRISLNDLFRSIAKITSATVQPVYAPERAGDVRDSQADITRAEQLLGYRPFVGLDEGLERTIAWYRTASV